jgi:hypothetical protein
VGWRKKIGEKTKKNDGMGRKKRLSRAAGSSSGDEGGPKLSAGTPLRGSPDARVQAGKSTLTVDFQSQTSNHGGQGQKQAAWAEAERDSKGGLVN